VTRLRIPDDVLSAAHARARARGQRDWTEADRLRGEIEAAGWKVVDRGTDFALSPASAPDLVEAGGRRYGSSASVPSRLADAPVGVATIVVVAGDAPARLEQVIGTLREHAPDGTQLVIVGDDPRPEQAAALDLIERDSEQPGVATEIIRTSAPLGRAAALNAGIRRAAAPIVVLLDASVEPTGDLVTPLVAALRDPTVAVAGSPGLVSGDLRRFLPAPAGDVDAIGGGCQAFRREDYIARGPLDERFLHPASLDAWWSLALRDGGEEGQHRRAVAFDDLPLRHREDGPANVSGTDHERLAKRNFYRLIDRFGWRRDLLTGRPSRQS